MKNIRSILLLGCILLNNTSSILYATNYGENPNLLLNLLKFANNRNNTYEAIADYFFKSDDFDILKSKIPDLKSGYSCHKELINITVETFKKMPVELRVTIYKAACGTKVALTKIKKEFLDTIKTHKATIDDYDKKQNELNILNKKQKRSEKENKKQVALDKELKQKEATYKDAVESLREIEEEYAKIDFNAIEQWINKIRSIAYWNSGSGFFEQFWNLNWSGKALTFLGTPLACYGAYKLYNDYQSAEEDEDTNTKADKFVAQKKLQ